MPSRERGGDRLRETFKVEVVSLAEHPYIVEIFHATIGFSKRHHSLEFFCDDCLPGVRAQTRRGKIEQYGQVMTSEACRPSTGSGFGRPKASSDHATGPTSSASMGRSTSESNFCGAQGLYREHVESGVSRCTTLPGNPGRRTMHLILCSAVILSRLREYSWCSPPSTAVTRTEPK